MTTELTSVAVHPANETLALNVAQLATAQGFSVRRNQTNMMAHDGYTRYVVLNPAQGSRDYSIRSRACIAWEQARHSRNSRPSIIGERRALTALLGDLS